MYGTVVKLRLKQGCETQFKDLLDQYKSFDVPGYVGAYTYRMDADPQAHYLAVLFSDRASYVANAEDPAQNERFLAMRALLDADPEWNDGEVIHPS